MSKKPYNHLDSIRTWYETVLGNALAKGNISASEHEYLCKIAEQMVRGLWLRGDISIAFKERGFGPDKLEDLYL
jgi:hypothetical protein